ncbi:hypothetical protein DFH09DRAFT_1094513 [Mycena vulgaris]|nr:hypothetical protein DFH09DRAFT_1094513 [Mycena vulgaris]
MDRKQYDRLLGLARDFLEPSQNLSTPAPTLQDLLNPIPLAPNSSEATLFNNPDPYGHADHEEDEEDDMDTGPVVRRSSNARRLAIEHYVNLKAPALLARLDPGSLTKATGSTSATSL